MKIHHFVTILFFAAALLLAGCRPQADPPLSVPLGASAGDLSPLQPCEYRPLESKAVFAAECGTLAVPEIWDQPASRLIALPVVRILAANPGSAEPVFYLQGGPGQSNLSWSPPDWLLADHDLVFVGYRGLDGSVTLACPEVSRLLKTHAGRDMFSPAAHQDYRIATAACAADHQAAGVDLSGYTIPGVVADLEAARSALGYERIHLLSESYGTRVAQIYAYLHPDSLRRLILIGVNPPGGFIYDRADFDAMLAHISGLCAADSDCSRRTDNLARTMYQVNRSMPQRWLFFNIDPDTVRLGTQFLFMNNPQMPMVLDAYLAAGEGDPAGLAMINLLVTLNPIDRQVYGDLSSKAASADLEQYTGIESLNLANSVMGAPMAEWIWPVVTAWPVKLIAPELRQLQPSEVEMLLVNGTVDFSTPPSALDEIRPFYRNAQQVLLPEFSHITDVMTLQPQAFERLVTSYYATGQADASLFVYQPLSFKPSLGLPLAARLLTAVMILLPALLVFAVVRVILARARKRIAR